MKRVQLMGAAALCWLMGGLASAAQPSRGELLFQTCSACHPVTGDGPGPDLHGIYGRKSGTVPDYEYSEALRNAKLVWNARTLAAFIAKPQEFVKGTKMTFPGYDRPADVAAVVAWLKQMR
jgi:cytochrome c